MDWQALTGPILGTIGVVIAGWVGKTLARLLNRMSDKVEQDTLQAAARAAVKWAAQKLQDGVGSEKYQQVLEKLKAKYPKLPEQELDAAIEAAVHELNSGVNP